MTGGRGALGSKASTVLAATKYDAQQQALIELAKYAKMIGGVTRDQAQTLLGWAREYGLVPARDHIDTTHWRFGPHIEIGPVDHIRLGRKWSP